MKKYIIDTDLGDDIDDAFALDLALRTELDLLCVTTVFKNTRQRASIAKKLLFLYGKHLPVYAGLSGGAGENDRLCQWTDDLDEKRYAPENADPQAAPDAIVAAARKYKKEFVLLAIGPLTNVAAAIEKDPEAMRASGGIVMMGGDFVNHYAEWNIRCDIGAAAKVFSSGVKILSFGHEVTSRTRLNREQQDFIFSMNGSEYLSYLALLSRLWYKSKPEGWLIVLHDVLVARYAADPSFCKTGFAPVVVEQSGDYTAGMTVNLIAMELPIDKSHPIEYATEVDIPEFIGYFLNNIGYIEKK